VKYIKTVDFTALTDRISEKKDNAGEIALEAAKNTALIPLLIECLESPRASVKYKAIKVLREVSRKYPASLYPHFDFFVRLLDNQNNIFKWNAIDIVGELTAADKDDKFTPLFEKYYGLLKQGSLITSNHVAETSPVIVKNKPWLEGKITTELLAVEQLPLPTEECRDIFYGKVIAAFSEYAAISSESEQMLEMAQKLSQKKVIRPATKNKAEAFIRKYGH
jgi:hypothetical protein